MRTRYCGKEEIPGISQKEEVSRKEKIPWNGGDIVEDVLRDGEVPQKEEESWKEEVQQKEKISRKDKVSQKGGGIGAAGGGVMDQVSEGGDIGG